MTLNAALFTRLEKVALDNGFDLPLMTSGDWLGFGSSQAPLRIWLTQHLDGDIVAAFSAANVAQALTDLAQSYDEALPVGAVAALTVSDIPVLHHLVRRAFQLSRTLPNELLHTFEKETAALPLTTEAERLVVQRVGQDIFRKGLIEYWEGRCAITGLARVELLRASHIKPWAACETDAERLDVFNGLLLAPHLDALFDAGLITVDDRGEVRASPALTDFEREVFGIFRAMLVSSLTSEHQRYLDWHREKVFRRG